MALRPSAIIWSMKEPVKFISYRKAVYRNFATVTPSQNLVDDLVADPLERKTLGKFFYSPENLKAQPVERVLERSLISFIQEHINPIFTPDRWRSSRFSDGTWPVLYSAEDEETCLNEVAYHLVHHFYSEEIKAGPVLVDRRVVKLKVSTKKAVDLTESKWNQARLASADESGYPYCQQATKTLLAAGGQLLKTPSSRRQNGICVPILDRKVISKDEGHLRYIKLVLREEGVQVFKDGPVVKLTSY